MSRGDGSVPKPHLLGGLPDPQTPSVQEQDKLLLVPLTLFGLLFPPGPSPKGSLSTSLPPHSSCPLPYPSLLAGAEYGGARGRLGTRHPGFVPYLSTGTTHKSLGYLWDIFRLFRFGVGFWKEKAYQEPVGAIKKKKQKIDIFIVEEK